MVRMLGANEYAYAVQDACLCFLRVDTCEASLKRMGVDCIDLYQLHRSDYLM